MGEIVNNYTLWSSRLCMPLIRRSHPLGFVFATLLLSLASSSLLLPVIPLSAMAQAPTTIQNRQAEAMRLYESGVEQLNLGQFPVALQKFQQALAIYQEIGDSASAPAGLRKTESRILNNIGLVYRRQNQYPQALKFYQQALTILKQVGDKDGERTTLYNIGLINSQLGEYSQALDFLQQALAILPDRNDRPPLAGIEKLPQPNILIAIGRVYESLGQSDKARDFYRQAQQLTDKLSKLPRPVGSSFGEVSILPDDDDKSPQGSTNQNQTAEAMRLYQEGVKQRNQGQFPAALANFNQALAIYRTIGDKAGEARTLQKIGTVYFRMGKPRSGRESLQKALELFQQAQAIYKQIGNRRGEAQTLNNIGAAYFRLRQFRQALNYFRQAVAIYREIGDRRGESLAKKNLNTALASASGSSTILLDDDDNG